jgi:hypothetical protein
VIDFWKMRSCKKMLVFLWKKIAFPQIAKPAALGGWLVAGALDRGSGSFPACSVNAIVKLVEGGGHLVNQKVHRVLLLVLHDCAPKGKPQGFGGGFYVVEGVNDFEKRHFMHLSAGELNAVAGRAHRPAAAWQL